MLKRNANITLCRATVDAILTQATVAGSDTVGGPLNGAKYKYFTDENEIGPDSVLADKTLADLGSGGATITFAGPVNLDADRMALKAQLENVAGAAPTVETINGVLILNNAADTLLGGCKFSEGVPITIENDLISVDLVIPYPFTLETGLEE